MKSPSTINGMRATGLVETPKASVIQTATLQRAHVHSRVEPSPIRTPADIGPVQLGESSPEDFLCGRGATKASIVAPASPGSRVVFSWVGGDGTTAV